MAPTTHEQMVALAARWLRRTGHRVVLSDVRTLATTEQPDAIGWRGNGTSSLVECKVSRADFLRDRAKWFRRRREQGMGQMRWFAAPAGMLTRDDVPTRWGVLELHPRARSLRIAFAAVRVDEYAEHAERMLLVTALARATEGWGRRMFFEDGDPGPATSRVLRDLRAENARLREELKRR